MSSVLQGKNVVLGVTGSIACYKALDLTSKLAQLGAQVDVILTTDAAKFVTSLAFRSLTHRPVVTDMFDTQSELAVEHVALARRAGILAIAPATAHTLARLAQGLADDALTATALATEAPCSSPQPWTPTCGTTRPPSTTCPCSEIGAQSWSAPEQDASHQA